MGFFKRSKQAKKGPTEASNGKVSVPSGRPRWQSTWTSTVVEVGEIEELVHIVTSEMKLRAEALDSPFLLLPFRPSSDPNSARIFINGFFKNNASGSQQYRGTNLQQELRLTDPTVLCSILKWCWSRMPRGVVSWAVYDAFQLGEQEANMARNAFDTFIPLGSDSPSRTNIIIDFFDLLAAIAAHGKSNGLGGRKLSRLAGWWCFEHSDDGTGFEGGYRSWTKAADASSHLFFAYLRSLSPNVEPSMNVIERIPRSLQALLAQTEYPPDTPVLLQRTTPRVVMIVDQVSSTPFSLLRRAKHFEYRQSDRVLKSYSDFDDPVDALTDECKRVLYAIASTNSSGTAQSRHGLAKSEETWTSFTSVGFGDLGATNGTAAPNGATSGHNVNAARQGDIDRPTTPSWGDFLSSGFQNEVSKSPSTMLLPPDKVLPPIQSRTQTPSIRSGLDYDEELAPGELAAITTVELDDAFWWVWMTSLAGEEPNERKAVFGRCALIETSIANGQWLIMEEQVKGASPDQLDGAQYVEKKSRFSFRSKNKLARGKSNKKSMTPIVPEVPMQVDTKANRMTISAEQQAKIKEAAADLARKNDVPAVNLSPRRGRHDELAGDKTQSTMTMGLTSEAAPAMRWANTYDKDAYRSAYLGSDMAGTGQTVSSENLLAANTATTPAHLEPIPEPMVPVAEPEGPAHKHTEPEPTYNPMEKELGPPAPEKDDHPAFRAPEERMASPTPQTNPAIIAAKMALEGRAVSPESTKSSKLKKNPGNAGSGGLRKFFSRNKDKNARGSVEAGRSAGAASAASDVALTRNLQTVHDQPTTTIVQPETAAPARDAPVFEEPVAAGQHSHYNGSTAVLSKVDSHEQREADTEFSRFDQGPMHDMPAAAPVDGADEYDEVAEPPTIARYSPRNPAPYEEELVHQSPPALPVHPTSPVHEPTYIDDAQSEATMEDHHVREAASPMTTVDSSKDRWERIRENAARRAANARASEDTSTVSRPTESGRTDDGETSGEETIESRVARIKARVAELTSNMDSSAQLRR